MRARGLEFLEDWIQKNITHDVRHSVDGDVTSLAPEMAKHAIADAAKRGLSLNDVGPKFGILEKIIKAALQSSERAPAR